MTQVNHFEGYDEKIMEVVALLYPFSVKNPFSEMTQVEQIKHLGVYDYRTKDLLVEHGTEEEIHQLILYTVDVVLEQASTFPPEKVHQLKWGENLKKVHAKVADKFPVLFGKVQYTLKQENIQSQLSSTIENAKNRVFKTVTALISTEEEANGHKTNLTRFLGEISEKVEASECDENRKVLLLDQLEKAKQECLAYVDTKLAEAPTRVLYYKTGSGVSVKLRMNRSSFTRYKGRGREVRLNQGEDYREYPLIVSVNYLHDFLLQNGIRFEDVLVDPNSLERFYQFKNRISANLTPAFVREWYNYDCPNLERHEPNTWSGETMFGQPLPHFTTILVESWKYIAEDVSEEEVASLSKNYEHTGITRELRNALTARKLKEEGKMDEVKTFVNDFDSKVQAVIDAHEGEILNRLQEVFKDRVIHQATGTDGAGSFRIESFGFDCGFLNIYTSDQAYQENRSFLSNIDKSETKWMNVRMPYGTQSLTVNREQFAIVKDIVQRASGVSLYHEAILD